MLSELKNSPKVVGIKQLRKALSRGALRQIFLADNADPDLTGPVAAMADAQGVPVVHVATMKELGLACSIAVGAAAAGLLRRE